MLNILVCLPADKSTLFSPILFFEEEEGGRKIDK